jgi:hypothetical protein
MDMDRAAGLPVIRERDLQRVPSGRANAAIVGAEDAEQRPLQRLQAVRRGLGRAVRHHHRIELALVERRELREPSPHAETDHADTLRIQLVLGVITCRPDVLACARIRQAAHELVRQLRIGRDLAAIEVGAIAT